MAVIFQKQSRFSYNQKKVPKQPENGCSQKRREQNMENPKKRILLIEDDTDLREMLCLYLNQNGFLCSECAGTKQAGDLLTKSAWPDLIILDWNLPDENGLDYLRNRKADEKDIPVLMLTVHDSPQEMIAGLDGGADDYVVKPFEPAVLLSRIRALLRRNAPEKERVLRCQNITLDPAAHRVWQNRQELLLSLSEFEVLHLLMENKGRTLLRRQIIEQVWEAKDQFVSDNTLSMTVRRLREKLDHPECLKTVRSFGYRLEDIQ